MLALLATPGEELDPESLKRAKLLHDDEAVAASLVLPAENMMGSCLLILIFGMQPDARVLVVPYLVRS